MQATIEVTGLRKRFGPTVALDGMSFTVAPGHVTGFVGPNVEIGVGSAMRAVRRWRRSVDPLNLF